MTSETDAEFLNRLNHEWVHDCVPCVEDWERLFALARRGAAVENPGQNVKQSEGSSHDLVERLRQWSVFGYGYEASCTMKEAATAIEAQYANMANAARLLSEQTARIEQLEAENASLASWQCEFTDGKTGLVYGEGGSTYCAMEKRVKELEGQHKGLVLQNALLRQRPDLPVDRIPAAAEVRALIARIEQLEAALRPFAECAKVFDPDMIGGTMPKTGPWQSWPRMVDDKLHMYELTVENLRDARCALGKERI